MVKAIIGKILLSKNVRSTIELIVEHYYVNHSLKSMRIWGPKERLVVGVDVHLNDALINTVCGKVEVGPESFLGHDVALLTGTHKFNIKGIKRQSAVPSEGRDILIGRGVWIGSRATIIGPCTIGDNSVISAGVTVSEDIPEGSLVRGEGKLIITPIVF